MVDGERSVVSILRVKAADASVVHLVKSALSAKNEKCNELSENTM